MPKMEKGRPPENKRSRKPAHPVKREVSQEMKSFAESTMNELLGWYGYDKVDLQDSEAADIRSHNGRARRHQVSVLKENSDPKPSVIESKMTSDSSVSAKNGVKSSTGLPLSPSSSSFSPPMKDLHSTHVVVPLIKPSAVDEQQNVQIVCVWCQKEGLKRYSLVMGSEHKSFCSEKCFAMCRRAYFKRNKAQNENRHGELSSSPPPGQTEETIPQLMLKMNSNTRVCDWCKHVRHTKYLDLGAGDDRLQFCSTKCLNQYKMDIFYREARAALTTSGSSPSQPENENRPAGESETLLTPESWNNPPMEGNSKEAVPPKVSTPVSSACSSTSSVRASVLAHQKERESSASSQLQTGTLMPSTPPPQVVVEQPWVIQKPQCFNRAPIYAQPRNPGSSPHQRPSHTSPQVHTPAVHPIPPPQLLHPYPSMIPCAPTYPHPFSSFMPTLGLPCPQQTVLVPYPIIVPLPVPVPIPIPIPMNTGAVGHARVIRNHKEKDRTGRDAGSVTPEDVSGEQMSEDQETTNGTLMKHTVKTEQTSSPEPYSPDFSSHSFPILPVKPLVSPSPPLPEDQRQEVRERQVIQRAICRVKQEGELEFDLNRQTGVEQENGWSRNVNEDDLIAQMSTKVYTGTLKHTSSSTPENAFSPMDSPNARASIILQKSLNTTSVVTPTASILLNNTVATSNSVHSSTCVATGQSDPEQLRSSDQNPPPLPESEDVKENVSEQREPGMNGSLPASQTNCQTDQSEESREGAVDCDALAADEHAYARSIPPKLREKNAHTLALATAHTLSHMVTHNWDKSSHMHVPAFEQSGMHTEIEPALKRRCLRIRDQNK